MTAIDILRNEHRLIILSLAVLANISDRLDNHEPVELAHLSELVTFYRLYADKSHHTKEEDLLFQAMAEAKVPDEDDLVGSLLLEHTLCRAFVDMMEDAVDEAANNKSDYAANFSEAARGFVLLMSQHICKEDHTLYPMAEKHFSDQQLSDLTVACNNLDREHQAYADAAEPKAMLERLRAAYGASEKILGCCP